MEENITLKYCLYARKSSESDERQALSIDSQITEMKRLAEKKNIKITETIRESHSAKESGKRIGYLELIKGLVDNRFNSIITWAPDRLSRNAGDLGSLVDLMDKGILQKIQTFGQTFTNTPDEKFLLMILCSQAKLENDNRAKNVKRGMRTKCEMGVRPGCVPLGYKIVRSKNFREPSKIIVDQEKAPLVKKLFEYVCSGSSGKQAWEYVSEEGLISRNNKKISAGAAYRYLRDPFYYGEFEYPKGSGNWYKGSHTPIINKNLFDKTQKNIKEITYKGKWGRKQFYFSKLIKCGSCGGGVCGVEQINRHGKLYTYYRCTKSASHYRCKEKYIREEKLIRIISEFIIKNSPKYYRLNERIQHELEKMNRLNNGEKITANQYIKDILKNGNSKEKADMVRCLDKKLVLSGGEVKFE